MARKTGLDFVPVDIGAMDSDDKLFVLLSDVSEGLLFDKASAAEFGRYVLLLGQIYAEGWSIQIDDRKARRIAQKLCCTSLEEFSTFISHCINVGLFDRDAWETDCVLTSKGIQNRYIIAKKRSKKDLKGKWVLIDDVAEDCGELRDVCGELREDCGENSAPYIREEKENLKTRELKEEEEDKASASSANVENSGLSCMAEPELTPEGQKSWEDINGKRHMTRIAALRSSFAIVAPVQGCLEYERNVACMCPHGCRGDPDQASACLEVVLRALDRYDPAKGSSPWLLTRKMLTEDRKFADG